MKSTKIVCVCVCHSPKGILYLGDKFRNHNFKLFWLIEIEKPPWVGFTSLLSHGLWKWTFKYKFTHKHISFTLEVGYLINLCCYLFIYFLNIHKELIGNTNIHIPSLLLKWWTFRCQSFKPIIPFHYCIILKWKSGPVFT